MGSSVYNASAGAPWLDPAVRVYAHCGAPPSEHAPPAVRAAAKLGLGRIAALYCRSSTLYHNYAIKNSVPLFLNRQCDRTLGEADGAGPRQPELDGGDARCAPARHRRGDGRGSFFAQ
jgi:hypothetical protein